MSEPISVAWGTVPFGYEQRVSVTCPDCKQNFRLNHNIATDGTVTPSLECPTPGCGFHEMVQLLGWTPP